VLLHSGINLLVNVAVLNIPQFSVTTAQYLTLVLLDIPPAVYGFYLLSKVDLRPAATPDIKTPEIRRVAPAEGS
jgi:hypothetical protein